MRAKVRAAPSSKNTSGPSGSTQVAAATPKKAVRFRARAAHSPAASPNNRAASRYISQVEPANRAMNGSRTQRP